MLYWHKKYDRNRTTMTAYTETGHTLTIISTGITNAVHTYEKGPGDRKKTKIATVPSTELAMLCAEQQHLYNLRGAAFGPEDSPKTANGRREKAAEVLEQMKHGPQDHFVIQVPKGQSLTAQRVLESAGLQLRMAPHLPPEDWTIPGLVPQTMIREAAVQVNEDLDRDGLAPLLKLPPILGGTDHPEEWLAFFHREYRWDRAQKLAARVWEEEGRSWPETAAGYPKLTA